LLIGQPRRASQPIGTGQGLPTAGLPIPMPPRRGLRRDPQLGNNISLPRTTLEQRRRAHPTLPQRIDVQPGGVALARWP
jgi:hypothetical protein